MKDLFKISTISSSTSLSLILTFILYPIIFPYLYMLGLFIFTENHDEKFVYKIGFWIVFLLFNIFLYKFLKRQIRKLKSKKHLYYLIVLSIGVLGIFLIYTLPRNHNFPLQTSNDINKIITSELDEFFKYDYNNNKASNYQEIENAILNFYYEKLDTISNQYDFSDFFGTFNMNNSVKRIIVDTILFNNDTKYFLSTILIEHNDNSFVGKSVIGMNTDTITVFRNKLNITYSGRNKISIINETRKLYFLNINIEYEKGNKKHFNSIGKQEYWQYIERYIKTQTTNNAYKTLGDKQLN